MRLDFAFDMNTYTKADGRLSGHTNHQQVPEQLPSDVNKAWGRVAICARVVVEIVIH